MATRQVLAELLAAYEQQTGQRAAIEAVGGVDAAKRVQAGEAFDVVVLASDAIDKLIAAGAVVAGSRTDWVRSGVAVAVRASAPLPDIGSEDAVRSAVLAARSISYSTGPSGVALAETVRALGHCRPGGRPHGAGPPGVPVGSLVARGDVELGFQQLSELLHVEGITIVGPLPPAIQITTIFSSNVAASSQQPEAAKALLDFFASPAAYEPSARAWTSP
ncbi:substrate-binding domain-containing protein [Delftia sp.]|uniref:substrate-binding domain-containing protein n=1 Tax=Delftia sp. TaxID=1886637 RepID=UPI00259C95BE|nr:substrate-binding domain-containing protein [Delftia sp.]